MQTRVAVLAVIWCVTGMHCYAISRKWIVIYVLG